MGLTSILFCSQSSPSLYLFQAESYFSFSAKAVFYPRLLYLTRFHLHKYFASMERLSITYAWAKSWLCQFKLEGWNLWVRENIHQYLTHSYIDQHPFLRRWLIVIHLIVYVNRPIQWCKVVFRTPKEITIVVTCTSLSLFIL
jgi:hypothetical protein